MHPSTYIVDLHLGDAHIVSVDDVISRPSGADMVSFIITSCYPGILIDTKLYHSTCSHANFKLLSLQWNLVTMNTVKP